MAYEKYPVSRPGGPFDDSAPGRLRHMGLLTAEGKADQDALAVAARLYAGGGILKESREEDEWQETCRKMQPMLRLFSS